MTAPWLASNERWRLEIFGPRCRQRVKRRLSVAMTIVARSGAAGMSMDDSTLSAEQMAFLTGLLTFFAGYASIM
jgi:hypothetical protein